MVLDEYVDVVMNAKNIEYYKSLGYDIPNYIDSKGRISIKRGTKIGVRVCDLPEGSHVIINCSCDICNKHKSLEYRVYLKNYRKHNIYTCENCSHIKNEKTCISKYGCTHPMKSCNVVVKMQNTNIERYGVPCALQNKDIYQKLINTNSERYGTEFVSQLDWVREKIATTNLNRYGCENYLLSEDCKEKTLNTLKEKYGENISHNMQVPEVRNKAHETMFRNGSCATSSQQNYICNLYGLQLNYPYRNYNLDMYDDKYKIDVEYDGSGHRMISYRNTDFDYKKFNKKETVRDVYCMTDGIKVVRIISEKDKLPTDEILLDMYEISKKILRKQHIHKESMIKWFIDKGTYILYPSKEVVSYDYGKLRKVR